MTFSPCAMTPLATSASSSASPRPRRSARTARVSAPCGRPVHSIDPGVSDSRYITFCMRTGPSSGSSTVVIVSSAWYCGSVKTSAMS